MNRPIVETTHGPVAGVQEGGLHFFRGIPFAAPPVAALRWLPPQPVMPWREVRQAAAFGPVSPQNPIVIGIGNDLDKVEGERNEDCLYLNVCTPGTDEARRPVMVWIHGGGFVMGAGTMPLNDPRFLAARGDVVVVSLNYRMANFGFLRLEGITGGAIPATGNEGLLDQVAALEWVRDNIARFGGDPGDVTVFGQSAGAISIGMLLAMPAAGGLLHRGILQSGACQTVQPRELADRIAAFVLESAGVSPDDPAAIRALPRSRLVEIEGRMSSPATANPELGFTPFEPNVDGKVIPGPPIDAVRDGIAAGIDLLVGATLDEYKPYGATFQGLEEMDHPTLVAAAAAEYGRIEGRDLSQEVQELAAAYRDARTAKGLSVHPGDLYLVLEGDRNFWMQGLLLAEAQTPHPGRVFNYMFTWPSPWRDGAFGAYHGIESGFVFGTIDATNSRGHHGEGPQADALAAFCQDAWLNFARTGDPSGTGVGPWPEYGGERNTMLLGARQEVVRNFNEPERRAWEAAGYPAIGRM